MNYTCPVCFYDKLQEPARDYNICVCCGTEFGSDDDVASHEELRSMWIAAGARWFFGQAPVLWNPWLQLAEKGVQLPYSVQVVFAGGKPMDFRSNAQTTRAKPAATVESQFGVAA
jgi:hypothetical protein